MVLSAFSAALRTVVVRPGIVYGGGRGIVADLIKDALNGLIRVVGPGKNRWPCIYDHDLGDLYVRILESPAAAGDHPRDRRSRRAGDRHRRGDRRAGAAEARHPQRADDRGAQEARHLRRRAGPRSESSQSEGPRAGLGADPDRRRQQRRRALSKNSETPQSANASRSPIPESPIDSSNILIGCAKPRVPLFLFSPIGCSHARRRRRRRRPGRRSNHRRIAASITSRCWRRTNSRAARPRRLADRRRRITWRKQLSALGIEPGAPDGTYFQQVPIVESVVERNFVLSVPGNTYKYFDRRRRVLRRREAARAGAGRSRVRRLRHQRAGAEVERLRRRERARQVGDDHGQRSARARR